MHSVDRPYLNRCAAVCKGADSILRTVTKRTRQVESGELAPNGYSVTVGLQHCHVVHTLAHTSVLLCRFVPVPLKLPTKRRFQSTAMWGLCAWMNGAYAFPSNAIQAALSTLGKWRLRMQRALVPHRPAEAFQCTPSRAAQAAQRENRLKAKQHTTRRPCPNNLHP